MKEQCKRWFGGPAALPKTCYALAALLWLLLGVYGCVYDAGLQSASFALTDFQIVGLEPLAGAENGYLATSGDPQLLMEDVSDRRVRTVSYRPQVLAGDPREVCLYYTTRVGEPYSQDRRVFPVVEPDGRHVFSLPRGRVVSLRLDPCSPDGTQAVELAFQGGCIDLNHPATLPVWWAHFVPGWYQLFCLLLYPALAAAALDWLRAVWQWLRKR